jgi:Ca2+-binding EF-hand superfamily protein
MQFMATTGVFSDNPTVFDEFEFIDGDGDGVITKQELTPFAS